jgi:hypothetical protein
MNPLRDRTIEHSANKFLYELRDGHCNELLYDWEHDYRKKYAHFICDSEAQHALLSWELVDWESAPPLTILHYRGKRRNGNGQAGTYKELFTVTKAASGSSPSTTRCTDPPFLTCYTLFIGSQ